MMNNELAIKTRLGKFLKSARLDLPPVKSKNMTGNLSRKELAEQLKVSQKTAQNEVDITRLDSYICKQPTN